MNKKILILLFLIIVLGAIYRDEILLGIVGPERFFDINNDKDNTYITLDFINERVNKDSFRSFVIEKINNEKRVEAPTWIVLRYIRDNDLSDLYLECLENKKKLFLHRRDSISKINDSLGKKYENFEGESEGEFVLSELEKTISRLQDD